MNLQSNWRYAKITRRAGSVIQKSFITYNRRWFVGGALDKTQLLSPYLWIDTDSDHSYFHTKLGGGGSTCCSTFGSEFGDSLS